MLQFINRTGRILVTATLVGTFLSTVPLYGGHAQQAPAQPSATQPGPTMATHAEHSADRSEKRIKALHDKLRITAAQEAQWDSVAQAMRDNGKTIRASMMDRTTRLKTMTAVDDLKSYQIMADEHSDGLKRLIPAFEALYASMTPAQQKHADHVFGEHQRHRAHV
jgi:periplasmic protein CpxP/Spy